MNQSGEEGDFLAEALPDGNDEEIAIESVAPGLSRELKRLLMLLVAGLLAFAVLYLTPIGSIVRDVQQLRSYLHGDDIWAEMAYIFLVALLVALGTPRLLFYGLGGVAFGFWQGLLLAQLGSIAGSYLTFFAIRHGGREWLMQRFGTHRFVGKAFRVRSSVKAVLIIRQMPISSVMISTGLALSQVTTRAFLLGSFIGFLPQGVIAALIGSGVVDEKALEGFGKLIAAAVVISIAAAYLWQRGKKRRQE